MAEGTDKPSLEIELSELKRSIDMIFSHLEKDLKLKKIRLDHDYYACIDLEATFEILSEKDSRIDTKPLLGDLYEDWEFLDNMIRDGSAVALMFDHVAPLLRYIGYKALEQAIENKKAGDILKS